MEPKFIRITNNLLINLAHVVAVNTQTRRTDDSAASLYIDVYTTHGTYKCHDPYIDNLKAAIADRKV